MPRPTVSPGQAWDNHFETEAASYRLDSALPFLRKFIRSPFIQLPFRFARLTLQSRVLEAGCASGKFSAAFAMLGCKVTALDFSPAMLENAAQLKRQIEAALQPLQMDFVRGDLEILDLEPNQFDLVINEGVVEHWLDHAERRRVLANMARVCRRGGTVAIIIPNGMHPRAAYWIGCSPSFLSAPPMVRYDPHLLSDDLRAIGLTEIDLDGIYAWRTIDLYPTSRLRRYAGGALQQLIPLPRSLRLKWGIHLIGMGRKP